jgi:polysaccharide export outer membrane protein
MLAFIMKRGNMKEAYFYAVFFFLLLTVATVQAADKEYVIGKGDTLSIRVWGEDALSADTVVRPDGMISLPGASTVRAAGLTTAQLQASIAARIGEFVHEPMLSVAVHTFPNNCIVVHGPGTRSTVLPLMGKTTILQVLSRIQPDNNADLEKAYVERENQPIAANFEGLFKKGQNGSGNVEILAGDRLFIPLREARLVFVEGAVGKPSSLPHYEGMTVLEAIHLAGGFTKFADRNNTTIMRAVSGGKQSINVRMYDFTSKGDFSQNVPVYGGDIIFVSTSWF